MRGDRAAWLVSLCTIALGVGLHAAPADAAAVTAAGGAVRLTTRIDGAPISSATESHPIRLDPKRPAAVSLEVINGTPSPVEIRVVRLEGSVLGLTFFAYETSTALSVGPGATETLRFLLDMGDLKGQAAGLVVGSVSLLDAKRRPIASEGTTYDVRGSLRSVYGVFGVAVASLTIAAFALALLALARQRLPENRFRRALRFLTPGVGLGLSLVFTLSALRVFVPRAGRWVPIVLTSAIVLFALGYLTPSPEDEELDDDDLGDSSRGIGAADRPNVR